MYCLTLRVYARSPPWAAHGSPYPIFLIGDCNACWMEGTFTTINAVKLMPDPTPQSQGTPAKPGLAKTGLR